MRLVQYSGTNAHYVDIGVLRLYFSYETLIAFQLDSELIVSENIWSNTTGKHLNIVDGGAKSRRIPHEQFVREWNAVSDHYGFDAHIS